jgi:hypothetical protein
MAHTSLIELYLSIGVLNLENGFNAEITGAGAIPLTGNILMLHAIIQFTDVLHTRH